MASAGWSDTAAGLMQAAWQSGDEFNPWAAIYWLDTPLGEAAEPADRLAACDAVVRAYPNFVPGHDRRAEHLALMGRSDDALAACQPAAFESVPVALRGRAAWVEAQRGDRAKAIALMKQLVTDEPEYNWGWRQLTQWYDLAGRQRECLEAAEQLVKLGPNDPVARALRAEAKRMLGDVPGAKEDYAKAFELDPTFEAAGLQLVAAQLETNDLDGAADTLESLREFTDSPFVRLRAVQLAARQGDLDQARAEFRALATDLETPRAALRDAATAFAAAGWSAEADDELEAAALRDADGTPAAAGLWAERRAATGRTWQVADQLGDVISRSRDAGREAVLAYAGVLAESGQADEVAATVQRHAELLREEANGWALAGAALAEARNFALAAAWLADWRDRADCRPWMLRPLADALRALDRDAEADAVARGALELDATTAAPDFRAWLALSAAVAGRTEEAAAHLRAVDALGQSDGVKLLLAMAEALVMVQQAGPGGKAQAFREAKDHLHAAAGACAARDVPPGAARWFRKAADRLAADAATLPARAWALWQRLQPWVKEA
jgi:hypothetical protein